MIKAFLTGMIEFRHTYRVSYMCWSLDKAYDKGRALAHLLTFRRFGS